MTFDPIPPFQAALVKIDGNLKPFETLFPEDCSVGNVYAPRKAWPHLAHLGLAPGCNIGWTTSFWTGQLWLAYQWTGNEIYRQVAEGHLVNFRHRLDSQVDIDHHDLGFLYTLSAVVPWRLTGSALARETALLAAKALMNRYIPTAGIFQAWGRMDDPEQRGRTIVDCMMNLPLLYWASQVSGDEAFAQAAERHAIKSAASFFRPDHSTFHTYYFDVNTGAPLYGKTAQGAGDQSCWARGQAWAIYGFALSYRYTRNPVFLDASARAADAFLARLPADRVAYWDLIYSDGSGQERDSSASAIAACGLLELARWQPDQARAAAYQAEASQVVQSLAAGYSTMAHPDSNALLLHGVYSKPGGSGVDEANLWGDYFYLEALMRLSRPDWVVFW